MPHISPLNPALNAIVMASAGTGKTWQLVTRLLRLLLTGAKPDSILAITFTRKAAREMESRLLERLYLLAHADDEQLLQQLREADVTIEHDTTLRARSLYEQVLRSPVSLRITTFHAFCQEILRRFPLEADVPPGFELSETVGEVHNAAWQTLLNELAHDPAGELASDMGSLLVICGGLNNLRDALERFVEHRGDWWSYTEDEEESVSFASERLRHQMAIDPQADPLRFLFTTTQEVTIGEFVSLLTRHPGKENDRQLSELAQARDERLPLELRFAALKSALLTKEGAPRSRKPSKAQAKSLGGEAEEARFLELAAIITEHLLQTLRQIATLESWRVNTLWYKLGNKLLNIFQRIKAEQRLLDFTDLEWQTYRLLTRGENAQWIQYKLDQRINHLLIDEFQDTNPTQWRLLLPLLQEMAAGNPERQRSVFLVGDAKQSIYRFRRAEPRLFTAAQEWLQQRMAAHTFPLHSSRRSSPAIIAALNKIFSQPDAPHLKGFNSHATHLNELWGRVVILPLPQASTAESKPAGTALRNPLLRPRDSQDESEALMEARQVAEEINRLIVANTTVGSPHNTRLLRYSDIMLLIRKRTRVAYFETALREAGIPYIGADRGTLLESLEVRDLIALLQLLITPYNNLALATVLRSPLFSCTSNELTLLAMEKGGNWWERLIELANASPSLQRASSLLQQWHRLAGMVPNHDLLDRIYNEGNVLERYEASYPGHLRPRVRANLIRLLELALEVDSGRYPSLNHFLARLEHLREMVQEAPDETPPAGTDRVRIMTIHAAKGLESPVVFLVDSNSDDGRDRSTYNAFVNWPAEEPRPLNFLLIGRKEERDPYTTELLVKEREQVAQESANLLYVALTRARQHLYISGTPQSNTRSESWYHQVRRALDPVDYIECNTQVVLEHGGMPPVVEPQQKESPPLQTVLPSELSHPVANRSDYSEIAPSHAASGYSMTTQGDVDGQLRGIAIHRFIQLLITKRNQPVKHYLAQVAEELDTPNHDSQLKEYYHEAERVVNHSPFAPFFNSDKECSGYCEVPLLYSRPDGSVVYGVVDRVVVTPDTLLLIDYKTHRNATPANIPKLAEHYREQLGLYATGLESIWPGRVVRSILIFTAPLIAHEMTIETPNRL